MFSGGREPLSEPTEALAKAGELGLPEGNTPGLLSCIIPVKINFPCRQLPAGSADVAAAARADGCGKTEAVQPVGKFHEPAPRRRSGNTA